MKSLHYKIILLTGLLTAGSFIIPSQELTPHVTALSLEEVENACKKAALKICNFFNDHVSLIFTKVTNHLIAPKNKADSQKLVAELTEFMITANILRNKLIQTFTIPKEDLFAIHRDLHTMLVYFSKIITLLKNAPFHSVPKFTLPPVTPKKNFVVTTNRLQKKYEQNLQKIITMAHVLENDLGLTWYNKAFRWWEQKIWVHSGKALTCVAVPTLAGALLGIFATTINRNFTERIIEENKYIKESDRLTWFLKTFLGERPIYDHLGKRDLSNSEKIGYLAYPEILLNMRAENLQIPLLIGGLAYFGQDQFTAKLKSLKKKKALFANWLRGGAYLAQNNAEIALTDYRDLVMDELPYFIDSFKPLFKYLEDPDHFRETGLVLETGYLLTGASGVGKTILIKALHGELIARLKDKDLVDFHAFDASIIASSGIGAVAHYIKNINSDESKVNKAKVIICFIDEIALAGLQATGDKVRLAEARAVLDGFYSTKNPKQVVIFIGATSSPELIDSDLKRPGRLGRIISFDKPTVNSRYEYLARHFTNLALNPADFNLDKIACETEGFYFNDLSKAINYMRTTANTQGRPINQELLDESIDFICRNIRIGDIIPLSSSEITTVAIQQVGTAAAHILLNSDEQVAKVTVEPITNTLREKEAWQQLGKQQEHKQPEIIYGGCFTYNITNAKLGAVINQKAIEIKIKTLLAGSVAERVILGHAGSNYNAYKKDQAFIGTLYNIVTKGTNLSLYSKARQEQMKEEAEVLIKQYETELTELFNSKKKQLATLADLLIQQKQLPGDVIRNFLAISDEDFDKIIEQALEVAQQQQEAPNNATKPKEDEIAKEILKEEKSSSTNK